ncbi:hypothetical protein TNCT_629101 [Trichonephila clavata]|uniref:Regulatory protein zeste n=1 Tax=Trichonephila clavata TaxID=2740835 RepID=A0A8X6KY13_TRICU|nr:hypothetical protein TNCT_629101 [Trichonephila clavata]
MSKSNLSVQEMELLVNLVKTYKHIINCKITNAVFNNKKEEAWDSLTTDFNAASLCKRSRQQLQNKFKNMQKESKKKKEALIKSKYLKLVEEPLIYYQHR